MVILVVKNIYETATGNQYDGVAFVTSRRCNGMAGMEASAKSDIKKRSLNIQTVVSDVTLLSAFAGYYHGERGHVRASVTFEF